MYRIVPLLPICLLMSPEQRVVSVGTGARPLAEASEVQEPLPTGDPVSFLEECLKRFDAQDYKGFSYIMLKQERINGRLQPSEEIEVFYRSKPRSVLMHWLKGQRKADSALHVEGENKGMMLVHPSGLAGKLAPVVSRDPEGPDAREAGRYSIKEAGLRETLARTLNDWKTARAKGTLQVKYLGIRKVVEAGDRDCYTLQRKCGPDENNGVLEVTAYIDKEKWLQVRTVLKGEENKLFGDYIIRDIRVNPAFKPDQFQRSALTN